ncbi:unnamed protein product [Sympodiomycopsis kandeliae]
MILIPVPPTDGPSPLPPPSLYPQQPSESSPASNNGRPQRNRKPSAAARAAAADSSARPSRSKSSSKTSSRDSTPSVVKGEPSPSISPRSTPEVTIPPFAIDSPALQRDLARVWEAINGSRRIVVVCGAGISVSAPADIPDFRSSTGLFKSLKDQHPNAGLSSGKDLFDARLFQSEANTALFYSMIASLHKMTLAAQPTLFHHFLKRLDEEGRLQRVYTQNIDALEERAGLTFGLGEGSAGRTFRRTASLGKRKRLGDAQQSTTESAASNDTSSAPNATRQAWDRVKSAPAVSLAKAGTQRSLSGNNFDASPEPTNSMFPRVIPLHGSLSNLVCTACDFKMSTLPEPSEGAKTALTALDNGEAPKCPECYERDAVRVAAGLRSRGIGFMKPDVVLYNGPNKSGERVGECLERDVLGLRDRLDGRVPETFTEEKLRLKKEEKDRVRLEKEQADRINQTIDDSQNGDESMASIVSNGEAADDVLGRIFEDDEEEEEQEVETATNPDQMQRTSPSSSARPSPTAKLLEGVRSKRSLQRSATQPAFSATSNQAGSLSQQPSQRNAKMKPLPPDLLIVAGTSLKVPGTKRVVREFAKAARARDGIIPKGCKSRRNKRGTGANGSRGNSKTPSNTSSGGTGSDSDAGSDDDGGDDEDGDEEREDGSNPYRPIRTILLNYDFPIPSKEWEGIFDVWVQGDVQAATGGLWSAAKGYGMGNPLSAEQTGNDDEFDADENDAERDEEIEEIEEEDEFIEGIASWETGIDGLDDERHAVKEAQKAEKKAANGQLAASDKSSTTQARSVKAVSVEDTKPGKAPSKKQVVPVVEIDATAGRRRSTSTSKPSASISTGNLAPSKKANGSNGPAANTTRKASTSRMKGQVTLDRSFPPSKKSTAARDASGKADVGVKGKKTGTKEEIGSAKAKEGSALGRSGSQRRKASGVH